jgi:hypothetical protein
MQKLASATMHNSAGKRTRRRRWNCDGGGRTDEVAATARCRFCPDGIGDGNLSKNNERSRNRFAPLQITVPRTRTRERENTSMQRDYLDLISMRARRLQAVSTTIEFSQRLRTRTSRTDSFSTTRRQSVQCTCPLRQCDRRTRFLSLLSFAPFKPFAKTIMCVHVYATLAIVLR